MSKRTFDKIAEGLNDAIAIVKEGKEPAKLFVPPEIDVRGIRRKVGLTQDDFASAFGFTVSQIRDWEQGRNRPIGAARAYLMIIDLNPDTVRELLRQASQERLAA